MYHLCLFDSNVILKRETPVPSSYVHRSPQIASAFAAVGDPSPAEPRWRRGRPTSARRRPTRQRWRRQVRRSPSASTPTESTTSSISAMLAPSSRPKSCAWCCFFTLFWIFWCCFWFHGCLSKIRSFCRLMVFVGFGSLDRWGYEEAYLLLLNVVGAVFNEWIVLRYRRETKYMLFCLFMDWVYWIFLELFACYLF